jgi:hypothetical protein
MNPRYLELLALYSDRDLVVTMISALAVGTAWSWHLLSTSQLVAARRGQILTAFWVLVCILDGAAMVAAILWKG